MSDAETNETQAEIFARFRRERDAQWTTYHVGDLPDEPYNGPEDHGWGDAGPDHDPR